MQDENVGPSHEHNQNDVYVPPPSDGQSNASPDEQIDVSAPPSPHGQNDASRYGVLPIIQGIHFKLKKRSIGKKKLNLIEV